MDDEMKDRKVKFFLELITLAFTCTCTQYPTFHPQLYYCFVQQTKNFTNKTTGILIALFNSPKKCHSSHHIMQLAGGCYSPHPMHQLKIISSSLDIFHHQDWLLGMEMGCWIVIQKQIIVGTAAPPFGEMTYVQTSSAYEPPSLLAWVDWWSEHVIRLFVPHKNKRNVAPGIFC